MNSEVDLKTWLHRDISRLDKLLSTLATFDSPCSLAQLKERALEAGLKIKDSWGPSSILSRSKGLAIRTSLGWEITSKGQRHLHQLGVLNSSPISLQVATGLRGELEKITDDDTRAFVEETIACFEANLFRSAIVMSWLAAVHVLQHHVVSNHLVAFNVEAQRVSAKWKPAKNADDLGRMREADFLERLAALSIIGKNVKSELKACLDRRKGCGHPNSLKIGANTVTHHLEVLLLNVFKRFAA